MKMLLIVLVRHVISGLFFYAAWWSFFNFSVLLSILLTILALQYTLVTVVGQLRGTLLD